MQKVMVDKERAFEIYYALGTSRSVNQMLARMRDMGLEDEVRLPAAITVSGWAEMGHWRDRIRIRDEEVCKRMNESAVATVAVTRRKELAQLEESYNNLERVKGLITTALELEQTLKIVPETTQDVAALYSALTRVDSTQVKIIELVRRIRGDSDNVNLSTTIRVKYEDLPTLEDVSGEDMPALEDVSGEDMPSLESSGEHDGKA
jgi:hypothetical protein